VDGGRLLALHADGFLDTLAWSPDGRHLAFTGALDGPSADVYLYDTTTDRVRRLTSDKAHELIWLPDSSGLVYLMGADPVALKSVALEGGGPVVLMANSGIDRSAFPPIVVAAR
jgi:Tol biopolymer transport system component